VGSQILARALGSDVRRGLRKEIGWYPVYLEPAASDDLLFGEASAIARWRGFASLAEGEREGHSLSLSALKG
jgi:GMP synthase-like glutamine amidotransferase